MAVSVRIPEVLQRYAPRTVEAPAGPLRDVLARVFVHHPDLESRVLDGEGRMHSYLLLFRNEGPADLADVAEDGDVLEIVAAAEGG